MKEHIPCTLHNYNCDKPKYDFLYFQQVFTLNEVKEIIRIGESLGLTKSLLLEGNVDNKFRDSYNSWVPNLPEYNWIYRKLSEIALEANSYFDFSITHFAEPLQFTRYDKGHHYTWHEDVGHGGAHLRKLSIVVNLSDNRAYSGGELQIFSSRGFKIGNELGSAVVFPSYKEHRVTSVKQGTRFSLVSWISGPPFR